MMASLAASSKATDYQSVQEDEVQALQAIYYDGYEELDRKSGPWKNASSRTFKLTLRSRIDNATSLDLNVEMTTTYPNTVPILKINSAETLGPKFKAEIEDLIRTKPKAMLGNEMIHEIAQAIEDILDQAVRHVEIAEQAPTLEEERALREKQAKEAEAKKAREKELELQAAKEAEKRRVSEQLAVELEQRHLHKRRSSHFLENHPNVDDDAEETNSESGPTILIETVSDKPMEPPKPTKQKTSSTVSRIDFGEPWIVLQGQSGRKRYAFKQVSIFLNEDSEWGSLLSNEGPATDVWIVHPYGVNSDDAKMVLKNIRLRKSDDMSPEEYTGSIDRLESLLSNISNVTKNNQNFLPVLRYLVQQDEQVKDCYIVRVLSAFAPLGSLHDQFLTEGFVVEDVRERIKELFSAMELLHSRGILHRRLHLGNIFITRNRKGGKSLLLADCGFQNELHRLFHPEDRKLRIKEQNEAENDTFIVCADPAGGRPSRKVIQQLMLTSRSSLKEEVDIASQSNGDLLKNIPNGWLAPELIDLEETVETSKTDIWDLGTIVMQMLFGPAVMGFESPEAALRHFTPSSSLAAFIKKMFSKDPSKRVAPFHLINDVFLNEKCDKQYGTAPGDEFDFEPLIFPVNSRPQKESQVTGAFPSRYENDFDEGPRIGKGGFGSVFEVKNKIDGQIYAIKKVRKSSATLYKAMSEIVLLSRLNHPNVVRYFGAWMESAGDKSNELEDSESEEDSETESTSGSLSPGQGTLMSRPSMLSHLMGDMDHVSSKGGYIEFGYDEDDDVPAFESPAIHGDSLSDVDTEDREADESSSANVLSSQKTRDTSVVKPQKQVLYIQMELCEKKTLRDLIMTGLSKQTSQIWSLLRNVVEGLAHIHINGIIHRDLKPENIFIESSGIPRIGDFGLATSGLHASTTHSKKVTMHSPDLTRSVGTAKYVAPEVRSGVGESYTAKVDMYSLGVILFEMCTQYETEYARTIEIAKLRERKHTLPSEFDKGEASKLGAIVLELVDHVPENRPTSGELLKSGKVPLKFEDEIIKGMYQTIQDPDNSDFPRIMDAIFSQPVKPVKEYAWDMELRRETGSELILQSLVKEELTSIFRLHGAVETARPVLIPRSNIYSASTVPLLHHDGTMVQLPYDLCLSNARSIAKSPPPAWKTFTFGSVYRAASQGGAPEPNLEVDFDIMSPSSLHANREEAETIKVMDDVFNAFPSLCKAPLVYQITHGVLLDLIMDFAHVPASRRAKVKETVYQVNFVIPSWQAAKKLLSAPDVGLSSFSIDQLARFNFSEDPAKAVKKIKSIFGNHGASGDFQAKLTAVFAQIDGVLGWIEGCKISRKIYLVPFAASRERLYSSGFMFRSVWESRKSEVIAVGGRYDSLIKDLTPNTNIEYDECHGVGFILGWGRIWRSMVRHQREMEKKYPGRKWANELGFWGARRCDVLVASMDSNLLRTTCWGIVNQLWNAGISAELAEDASSPEEIMAMSRPENHIWIVIVRQDTGSFHDDFLKVKDMSRKIDSEVRATDLVKWFRAELRERKTERKRRMTSEASFSEVPELRSKASGKK